MLPSTTTPAKDKYKIINWKAYNKSLQQRGTVSIWIEQSLLREWREIKAERKVVAEKLYSDSIIECCLLLGKVYHQPLRQTQGFVKSLSEGRKEWKIKEGYHTRSLNEVAMFGYKTAFTASMSGGKFLNQQWEVALKCKILNLYRRQGMPVVIKRLSR
jgi:hypothetical protein